MRPRELLVATAGPRSAYFDCGFAGGDPTSAIGYLSQRIGCRGVTIASIPDTAGTKQCGGEVKQLEKMRRSDRRGRRVGVRQRIAIRSWPSEPTARRHAC